MRSVSINITYCRVSADDVPDIVRCLREGSLVERLLYQDPVTKQRYKSHHDTGFYKKQRKVALRNIGEIDPTDIRDYLARDGYQALRKALSMTPARVVAEVMASGLRGRGGGGFPTGLKWKICAAAGNTPRYVICNGDEGDPGAFMDRSIMEGDPHSVLEGMIICAHAIGAAAGFIYVRDEYDLAVKALGKAIRDARAGGFLGDNVLGSGLCFDIEIVRGGGAFVCGEETALIASIEGNPGEPRDKYVYPTEKGLWGQPTVINNVETFVNVPVIIGRGAAEFAAVGTAGSKGTKVFSLVGKVMCALGRTAPNPVLSTIKYFRDEYLEHIEKHRCPAAWIWKKRSRMLCMTVIFASSPASSIMMSRRCARCTAVSGGSSSPSGS